MTYTPLKWVCHHKVPPMVKSKFTQTLYNKISSLLNIYGHCGSYKLANAIIYIKNCNAVPSKN
jgi:hypothetical protein